LRLLPAREKMTPEGSIMVHTSVDGTFRQTNLTNESTEYLATFRRKIADSK
jgi:hypothetical protein